MKRANPKHNNRVFEFHNERVGNRTFCFSRITCNTCPAMAEVKSNAALPDDKYAEKFRRQGWEISGRHFTCPACLEKRKPARPVLSIVKPASPEEPVNKPLAPASIAVTAEEIRAAKAEAPRVMGLDEMLLVLEAVEDSYDPKTGYKDGYSDARVADDLSCPVDWVRQVRTKKFGDLPETPAMTELRREIKAVEERVHEQARLLTFFEKQSQEILDATEQKFREAVKRIDGQLNERLLDLKVLNERLERIVNG